MVRKRTAKSTDDEQIPLSSKRNKVKEPETTEKATTRSKQSAHLNCKITLTKDARNNRSRISTKRVKDLDDVLTPKVVASCKVNSTDIDNVVYATCSTSAVSEEIKTGIHSDSGDESDDIDWEDVQEAEGRHDNNDTLSTTCSSSTTKSEDKGVEISIEVPGLKGTKRKKIQEDLMTQYKKAMNRVQKQIQLDKHKVHLLMLTSVGFHRNDVCNQPFLQAFCLSYIPTQIFGRPRGKWQPSELTNFLTWFKEDFPTLQQLKVTLLKDDVLCLSKLPQNLAEVLVVLLRSLGLLTRLVSSFQPMCMKTQASMKKSYKGSRPTQQMPQRKSATQEPRDMSTKQQLDKEFYVKKDIDNKASVKGNSSSIMATCISPSKPLCDSTKNNSSKKTPSRGGGKSTTNLKKKQKISNEDNKPNISSVAMKLRKKNKVDYLISSRIGTCEPSEEDLESTSDEDELFEKKKINMRTPKGKSPSNEKIWSKSCNSKTIKRPSVVEILDDDDDFEVFNKRVIRKSSSQSSQGHNKPVQVLSDDSQSEHGTDAWVEVYLSSHKSWFCIDMVSYSVGKPELCEDNASQPLTYVIGYDNEKNMKDVTGRYAANWLSKTQKMRTDAEWWEQTLLPYKTKQKNMDENEDSQILEQHQIKPLPQSITEYKNHPLYVLKRHLLKFEAIYPETAVTLGFIRSEAIYSRDCVHSLHTREKWMSTEARVVKKQEQPYKVVKGRVKRNQPVIDPNSVTIDLFGRWQTEDYKPPPAKDGKVPRNEYGNIELFKPSMLPPGTKHIQIPGIQKVAKKLGIDGAPAVVGFDFHCGFCHPVIDGLVVCKELVPTLMDAWRQEQLEAQRRKEEKRDKRVLGNWRLLVKSLLIRERLKKKYTYDTQESRTSSETGEILEDDKISNAAVAWPQNMKEGKTSVDDDGHCHVFPKKHHKKDKVSGEWTKTCACGLTLPLCQ